MKRLIVWWFTCRRIGHSPGIMGAHPVCVKCGGVLPGVWAPND